MEKYIRFRDKGFVVFDKSIQHITVASRYPSDKPLSAGYIAMVAGRKKCFGDSMTMGIGAFEWDTEDYAEAVRACRVTRIYL